MSLTKAGHIGFLSGALLVFAATTAHADVDADRCATVAEDGQRSRGAGRLRQARERFIQCSASACPSTVRDACAGWLDAVDATLPTIVIAARDEAGADVLTATVTLDGEELPAALGGAPISVDPGAHVLRLERPGSAPVVEQFVARTAERNRKIDVVLLKAAVPETAAPPARERPVPFLTYVLGGVAAGGFVASGIAYASAVSYRDGLRGTCAPTCPEDRHAPLTTRIIVADVALGAGIIAAGVAIVVFLTRPTAPPDPANGSRTPVRPIGVF